MHNQFQVLFSHSFDTYKVFDTLSISELNNSDKSFPKTIWQILNHLVKWQAFELARLMDIKADLILNETQTWLDDAVPDSQENLDELLATFNDQHFKLKAIIATFDYKEIYLQKKLKIVQDLSVHLSFHVGEVVLMRRLVGTYPLADGMAQFLN